jgi:hypothetical protein
MRSYVIDIVWSVIDTPKLGSLGETESPNGGPDRETEEERGQRLRAEVMRILSPQWQLNRETDEARNRLQSITFRQYRAPSRFQRVGAARRASACVFLLRG